MFSGEFGARRGGFHRMYEDMDPSMGPSEGEDIHLNVSIPFLDAVHGCICYSYSS